MHDLKRIAVSENQNLSIRGAPWDCPGMVVQFPDDELNGNPACKPMKKADAKPMLMKKILLLPIAILLLAITACQDDLVLDSEPLKTVVSRGLGAFCRGNARL